jgi:MFS family permease
LFAIRSFSAGNTSLLIAFAALFAANFLLPFFLERGQGLSDLDSGLLLTPLPLAILLIAPLSGALSDRIGTRIPSATGLVVLAVGLLSLTGVDAQTSPWGLIWRFAVVGTGIGLFNSPNQSSIMGSVPRPRLGNASGMIAQMRYTGQALGIAVGGAVIASRTPVHLRDLASSLPQAQVQREAFILAMHDAFYVAAAVCTVGIIASLIRDRREPSSTPRTGRSLSGEDQLLAGVALAYLTRRIRTSNEDSSNLIRAASRMVESNGEDSRRVLALRASDEVLGPLSQRLLMNYLRDREVLPEKALLQGRKRADARD